MRIIIICLEAFFEVTTSFSTKTKSPIPTMNMFIIFLSLLGLAYGTHFLEGSWVEDQYQRENLWNFMSSRGVNYLKIVFANAASFELEQEISKDGNTFTFSGMRKFWHFIAYSILEHKFIYTKSIRFELCKSIIHEMTIINNILFS